MKRGVIMYENNSQEKIIIDLCKRIDILEEEQKKIKHSLLFTGFIRGEMKNFIKN